MPFLGTTFWVTISDRRTAIVRRVSGVMAASITAVTTAVPAALYGGSRECLSGVCVRRFGWLGLMLALRGDRWWTGIGLGCDASGDAR
jgi:hypothetical protein